MLRLCYDFYSYTGRCYEHEDLSEVNHGVLIIAWDDSVCGQEITQETELEVGWTACDPPASTGDGMIKVGVRC